jgi:DNA-binding PadR family transcriptional regulator
MHRHFFEDKHHQWHCGGPRHPKHGKSRHGRGGDRGRGGGSFRIGRMIGDGDLRLIVLALLADQPRHGYDIIKALEEHSSGIYSPSPGIVYPTLTFLEEAGYAVAASEGSRRVYTITGTGRSYLEENRELADAVLSQIDRMGRKMARARDLLEDDERPHGDRSPDRDIPGVVPEVNDARRTLKAAIAEKLDSSADEQRRVASILREAAAAIRKPVVGSSREDDVDLG